MRQWSVDLPDLFNVDSNESRQGIKDYQVEQVQWNQAPFRSRCTVKTVHEIISRFDARKKVLVETIGFRALLKFPHLKNTMAYGHG